jgi:hypothetical protein
MQTHALGVDPVLGRRPFYRHDQRSITRLLDRLPDFKSKGRFHLGSTS